MGTIAQPLLALVERSVGDLGYELADLEWASGGLLRVSIDMPGGPGAGRAILIDDCEKVTRQLSHVLTVEGIEYGRLEVGSPGVDRRLRNQRDFVRFAGSQIDVKLRALRDGRRKLRGQLLAVDGDAGAERIRIALAPPEAVGKSGKPVAVKRTKKAAPETPRAEVEVALAEIETARLVPELNFKGIGRGVEK